MVITGSSVQIWRLYPLFNSSRRFHYCRDVGLYWSIQGTHGSSNYFSPLGLQCDLWTPCIPRIRVSTVILMMWWLLLGVEAPCVALRLLITSQEQNSGVWVVVLVRGWHCKNSLIPLIRIHGVCTCNNAEVFHGHIDQQLKIWGLTTNAKGKPLCSRDIVDVIERYKGRGYGLSTDEELGITMIVMQRKLLLSFIF